MRRTRTRPLLAVLALALVALVGLAACSGPENSPAAPAVAPPATAASEVAIAAPTEQATAAPSRAMTDPCSVVSKQEAEELAATELQDAVAAPASCTYTGSVTGPTAQVEVYLGDGAKKQLDIDRQLGHKLDPVSGLGDEAFIEDGWIFFSQSGVWVSIRLLRLDDPAKYRKPMQELARIAATRV
ncbi:hypothetical protein B0E53_02359 [Micromonospora sp. MH33]|uniref:DUF3558 domain-containing protein n=1 Tax=Micromonospora sp. MH33 TaxID=1945509 RepID=UPI000D14B73B|nr:DUF3558 domain-containing protein [Micromonospora sp. MH33]PSK65702.1 hypothetical protein B0E53_02359 [Micromonospora sp. MH33]